MDFKPEHTDHLKESCIQGQWSGHEIPHSGWNMNLSHEIPHVAGRFPMYPGDSPVAGAIGLEEQLMHHA